MNKTDPEKTTAPTDDSLIARWSRRKQAVRDEELSRQTPADIDVTDPPVVAEPRQLCDADMPPLDSLTEDSDYRGFLSPRVSESLRRQALRQLFHGPSFNVRDGLDDYDEEYTHFTGLGDIVTADMRHQLAVEAQRPGEQAAAGTPEQTQTQSRGGDDGESQVAATEAGGPDPQGHDPEVEL